MYHAAILEPNLTNLPKRIVEAESVLKARARELFYNAADKAQEGESLDEAMSILRVLRSSLKHQPTAIRWTSDSESLKRA
jgi:hypothetical protein